MPALYERDQQIKLQEVGDTIYIAESTKVPFTRLMRRGGKPKQMLAEWPVQIYDDESFEGTMDGTDISSFGSTNRDKVEAYGMWLMTPGWMATRLANLFATAGVPNEKAKQAADDGIKLAMMHEKQLLSDVDTQAESPPATFYRSRGVFSWLQNSAQDTKPVPASYRPSTDCAYTGALGSFMPADLEAMLEAAATAKRAPVDLTGYVGIKLKRQMSTWAQKVTDTADIIEIARTMQNASDKKLIQKVDFFEFDAGTVTNFLSWYLLCTEGTGATTDYTTRSGAFLDMTMWELNFADAPAAYVLPPQSGGPRGYHDTVFLARCLNPLGQCYVKTNT